MGTISNPENTTFNDQADGKFDDNVEKHHFDVEHHISTKKSEEDKSEYEHDSDKAEDSELRQDDRPLH